MGVMIKVLKDKEVPVTVKKVRTPSARPPANTAAAVLKYFNFRSNRRRFRG